jgi:hypothetical protein
MTKKQVAALRGVLVRATRRARESQNDGEGLWLHTHVVQPLTDVLARKGVRLNCAPPSVVDRTTDWDGAHLTCVRSKVRSSK